MSSGNFQKSKSPSEVKSNLNLPRIISEGTLNGNTAGASFGSTATQKTSTFAFGASSQIMSQPVVATQQQTTPNVTQMPPTFAFGANNDNNPPASLSGEGASSRRRAAAKTSRGRRKG